MRRTDPAHRRALAPLLSILMLLGCAGQPAPRASDVQQSAPDVATPLFWQATSPDGRSVFLLGSIHVGPAEGWRYPAAIETAYANATVLYVEFDARAFSEEDQEALLARYGMLPDGVHLRDRLSSEQYADLVVALEHSMFYEEDVGRLRPWMIANMLSLEAAIGVGLSPANGVDTDLLARSAGKRVVGLETAELQFAALAGLEPEAEAEALAETLALGDGRGENATALAEAWSRGDAARLEALLYEGLDASPAARDLFEAMVFARNRGMTERITRAVAEADPEDLHFVVVGAAHFLGERNIRDLLGADGYRVERIDFGAR